MEVKRKWIRAPGPDPLFSYVVNENHLRCHLTAALMKVPIFPGRVAVVFSEGAYKMLLIAIANTFADCSHLHVRLCQKSSAREFSVTVSNVWVITLFLIL